MRPLGSPIHCSYRSRWLNYGAALCTAIALVACGGESPQATADKQAFAAVMVAVEPAPSVAVTGITKVSETRISRTVFDYVFRITVKNNGTTSLTGVTAKLTGAGAGTTIINGEVAVGDLGSGAITTPAATITLQHDRTLPFDPSALIWSVTANVVPPPTGGLPGNPADNAADSIVDVDTNTIYPPSEYALDEHGNRILRTLIALAVKNTATVAEVNTLLGRIGGTIVYSSRGTGVIHIRIPDPGSLVNLKTLMDTVVADPAVEFVLQTVVPSMDQLPDAGTSFTSIRHHLAVRGSAAWNARNAVKPGEAPEILIADYFGDGAPNSDAAVDFGSDTTFVTGDASLHGYHVLGIMAGSFGGTGVRGEVTGMYAGAERLKGSAIDLSQLRPPFEARIADAIRKRTLAGAKLVVNTSLNNGSMKGTNSDAYSTTWAQYWARLIRGIGTAATASAIEDRYLHAASAGNINPSMSARTAFHNSPWNAAALAARIAPAFERFHNTLAVENRRGIEKTNLQFAPGCALSTTSFTGGNLSSIGSWENGLGIWSFTDNDSTAGSTYLAAGRLTQIEGTSMAAPQVAGLAAYLWGIRPELTAAQLVQVILSNPHDETASCADSASIDAYAATLALDNASGLDAPSATTVPVRLALLDVVGNNNAFTVDDFKAFLDAFFTPLPSPDATYTRYDLNGDGFVGGPRTARFNLNIDVESATSRKSIYSEVANAPNGLALRKANGQPLNENAVTDFEILCYYAHSNLFTGSASDINTALATKSTEIGRTISCSQPTEVLLNVETTNPGWTGLPAHIALSGLTATNKLSFNRSGSPGNTCGGEVGFPPYSLAVDDAASFFAVSTVIGMPINIGGPGINRRPCSSFYAFRAYGPGLPNQVWINATGRGQQFGGPVVLDWEIQIRYSNGDPRGPVVGLGKQCEVGVVANAGFFLKSFDAVCTHFTDLVRILE